MNENIGVKGGKQDRKRSFMIKKRTLEKLKKSQEKNIKKTDLKTFFKIIPLVIVGESFKILFAKSEEKKNTPPTININHTLIYLITKKKKQTQKIQQKKINLIHLQSS